MSASALHVKYQLVALSMAIEHWHVMKVLLVINSFSIEIWENQIFLVENLFVFRAFLSLILVST